MCDEVQGYLLGRPAAIGHFRHLTHNDPVDEIALDDLVRAQAKAG